jgi:hypothetical protein
MFLDRQHIASQLGLQLIFRMHNNDPPPQGVENRNILLWFKCVLTTLHVNCMILFDKVLWISLSEVTHSSSFILL